MQRPVAALTLVLWSAAAVAPGADEWIEVRTPNFIVASNAGEKRLRETAAEFEQVRAAYEKVWPDLQLVPEKPVVVLALRNEKTMKRWAPEYFEARGGIDVVSVSVEGADRAYLILRTDSKPSDPEVTANYNLYRAYLTLLLSGAFQRPLPFWLSNGFSEVLGNTSVREGEILMGRPVPSSIRHFVGNPWPALKEVFAAGRDSPLVTQEVRRTTFDATCYVLVHYLLFADRGAHSSALTRFQQLWQAGTPHDEAFAEAFGGIDVVEGALANYARSPILSYARFPVEARLAEQRPEARPLAPMDVSGLEAALHVAMGRSVEAGAAVREAREADPASPLSYDAEGLLADRQGDEALARAAYARAVELGSVSAHSHYRAAQLAWESEADAAALAARASLLERAIALNPSHANAHSFLAETLRDAGDDATALARAEQAIALAPGKPYHRLARARVLHALDRDAEAEASARIGLELARSESERSSAQRFLDFLADSAAREEQGRQRAAAAEACDAGDSEACAELRPHLESACERGEGGSCLLLGWLYRGPGLPPDAAQSVRHMGLACDAGVQDGCVERAWALARGDGVPADEEAGSAALEALCDGGVLSGCVRLGMILANEPGAAGRERARALFTRACEGGDQQACSFGERLN
jgi:TPR repeat protein